MAVEWSGGYETLEDFVAEWLDDSKFSFGFDDARDVAQALHLSTGKVIAGLQGYGFKYDGRAPQKRVRGFTTSSNDRWFGRGSSPTCGGSGWEQINGFGGQTG